MPFKLEGLKHPEMLERILKDHMSKPVKNWWSEDQWLSWFRELETLVKDHPELSKYLEKTCTHPEYLHWSRWHQWYDNFDRELGEEKEK